MLGDIKIESIFLFCFISGIFITKVIQFYYSQFKKSPRYVNMKSEGTSGQDGSVTHLFTQPHQN